MKESHEAPLAAHPCYHRMFSTLKQTLLLTKNEERYPQVHQEMPYMQEDKGRTCQTPGQTTST